METRVLSRRALVLPALFALLCVVLTIIVFTVFGGTLPFTVQGYRITIPFQDAANLVAGSDVEIAGVTIGKVVTVNRAGDEAAVEVQINRQFAPIRSGATAIARTKTLLGEGYVQLAPGPAGARPIADGGALPASQVRPTVALDQFVSTFDPATRARLRQLFEGLASAFDDREQQLNDTLGWSEPFTGSLSQVLQTVEDQRNQLGTLVATSGQVMQAIGQRQGAVRAAITASQDLLGATASRRVALAATVEQLAPLLSQLHVTSDAITAAAPELNGAVQSLLPAASLLAPALSELETASPPIRTLFDALPGTLAAGRRDLPAVAKIASAARRGFAQFYPTSRQLIPFIQLAAQDKEIVRVLANVGSTLGGSFVGPGGTVLNYLNAVPTFWNESVSGWTHKLPTNRQNPYPASPEALLETGQLGVLKAFDCRNTGNPDWLPPTGNGAPPCLLQGPFDFNRKRAYYPHLTLASP
jgi:phospholipid/cholesterol/gamma-HCH transport system substrate-binding protein